MTSCFNTYIATFEFRIKAAFATSQASSTLPIGDGAPILLDEFLFFLFSICYDRFLRISVFRQPA